MATNSLQSLNYRHHSPLRRHQLHHHSIDCINPSSSQISFKPIINSPPPSITHSSSLSTITCSLSSTTTTSPSTSQSSTSLELLRDHLSSNKFREADEETRRLLIALAGEPAQKRGYVFFSEVQFIPAFDLAAIDELWRQHSNNKFGYSVQKKIWISKANKDFTRFFIKVGWMKKLDTEIEQFNYRAFPNEFIWELNEETPEGHLPLTNALRGTQLLNSILNHPAFDQAIEEEEVVGISEEIRGSSATGGGFKKKAFSKDQFKQDYSF